MARSLPRNGHSVGHEKVLPLLSVSIFAFGATLGIGIAVLSALIFF